MNFVKFNYPDYQMHRKNACNHFSNVIYDNQYFVYPKIDISEDEKNIFLQAEVPGVKKDEIKISLENNLLTIAGEKKKSKDENVKSLRSERKFGKFSRSFKITDAVNPEKIDANLEDGILKITFEKNLEDKKNIEINIK